MHGTVQISVDTAPQHTLETSDSHSLVVLISKAYKANLSTEISSVDCDDHSTGLSDDTMRLSDDWRAALAWTDYYTRDGVKAASHKST